MLKKIVFNKSEKIRLIYKYPLIMILGNVFFFSFFGYVAIYGMKMFFEARTGMTYEFDYILASLFQSGFMDIQYELAMILVILLFALYVDNFKLSDLGLKMEVSGIRNFFAGVAIAAVFMGFAFAVLAVLGYVKVYGFYWQLFPGDDSLYVSLTYQIIVLLLVGFQEELLNRAYFIRNMALSKPAVAIVLSSTIFALLHLGNEGVDFVNEFQTSFVGILNIFIIGLIYGYYFYRTGDLWLVFGSHFSWNYVQGSILGMPISGNSSVGVLVTEVVENKLFTGGMFGPEGGIMVTASLILMFFAIKFYADRSAHRILKGRD